MHPRWGTIRVIRELILPLLRDVLRGHAGGGGGCRPAGLAPDRLRHPARVRDDRHPVGLHDHHADRPLLGLRPAAAPRLSGGLEAAPSPRVRCSGDRWAGPRHGRPARGPVPGIASARNSGCRPGSATRWSRATRRPWCSPCSRRCSPPSRPTGPRRPSSPASRSSTGTVRQGCRPNWCGSWTLARRRSSSRLGFSAVTVAGRFYRGQHRRCRCAGPSCRPGRQEDRHGAGCSARGRLRLRLRPLLATVPTGRRCRPCRGHRHDGAGDAGGASHAGRALRPRPARQRRTAEAAGGRPHDLRSPLSPGPSRRPSCGTCSTTRRTRSEPRRSGEQVRQEDGVRVACDALESVLSPINSS